MGLYYHHMVGERWSCIRPSTRSRSGTDQGVGRQGTSSRGWHGSGTMRESKGGGELTVMDAADTRMSGLQFPMSTTGNRISSARNGSTRYVWRLVQYADASVPIQLRQATQEPTDLGRVATSTKKM
jgi:hypothetical protein